MTDKAYKQFVRLSWALIEYKAMYYQPNLVHESRHDDLTIDDDTYDRLERRYLELCLELGRPNTVVHKSYPGFEAVDMSAAMMEIDQTRPSVQLVLRKLGTRQENAEL